MKGLHTKTYRKVSPADRFFDFVLPEPNTGCWLWTGGVNACGYGTFGVHRRSQLAHRVSYALHVGEIPKGLCVLHRCDVPCCVNPEHLFVGTQPENIADMETKGRGRHPAGPDHGKALLTAEQVREIRMAPRIRGEGIKIANKFGVAIHVIKYARKTGSWKNVI